MKKKPSRSSPVPKQEKNDSNGSAPHNAAVMPVQAQRKKKRIKQVADGATSQEDQLSGVMNNRDLLRVLTEVKNGNFSVRMPFDQIGISGQLCDTVNEIIALNERMIHEFTKSGHIIGKQGRLNQRIDVPTARGAWSQGIDAINTLISDLVHPTNEIARVISSVAKGNLSQEMPLEIGGHPLQGEFAQIAKEVNDMVKQLNLFSMEVTRVAREVGSEGK